MGFLYFRPHCTKTVSLDDVKGWGLGYAFTGGPSSTVCMGNTPNGSTGVIFADEKRLGGFSIQMNLDEQEWRKVPKSECYVGYWKAAPPTPEDLARPMQMPGYWVTMGDHLWLIPITARFDDSRKLLLTTLPCYLECDDDGNWKEGDVLAVHKHLWEVGQPFRDDVAARILHGSAPREFDNTTLANTAIAYLQANYVIGAAELSLMHGLQIGHEIQGAILAANDLIAFADWNDAQKKTEFPAETGGESSASGEAA